jgi:hypothetical protein
LRRDHPRGRGPIQMHYGEDLIRMHLCCMSLWESECRGRGARSK